MTFEEFDELPVEQVLILTGTRARELEGRFADILCPYHADTKPSATIYKESKMFVCFSCNEKRHISRYYRDVTGEELVHGKPSLFLKRLARELPPRVAGLDVIGDLTPVWDDPIAMEYIERRKIPKSFLEDFNVQSTQWFKVNGTFMGFRLIIPIIEKGRVVSYEGRAYTDLVKPKVLYPKGAPPPLFNCDSLDRKRVLILVEGLIDFAVLWGYGYRNLSTLMGASISAYLEKQLCEFDEIIMFMDPDKAGEAVISTFEKFYPGKLRVTKLEGLTPEGKPRDPKHGSYLEIERAIKGAVEPSEFYMKKFSFFEEKKPSLFGG